MRQVAIFNNNIAFTRLISFDSAKENLAEFAKNDIIRTSEYIKRFDTEFSFDKLIVITILDPESKTALRELKMEKTLLFNYTPFEISKLLKLGGNHITKEEKYSDVLLSWFSLKNVKNIKFGNQKINTTNALTKALVAIKMSIVALILLIIGSFAYNIVTSSSTDKILNDLITELDNNKAILQSKTQDNIGLNSDATNQIIEAGMLKDILDSKYINPVDSFEKFANAQKGNALTFNLRWYIDGFDYQDDAGIKSTKTLYDVSIINPDGTASKLFSKYDALNLSLKDAFKEDLSGMTSLPNNINFSQRYLTYPIKVEIMEKGPGYIDNAQGQNYDYNYNLEDGVIYE